MSHKAEITFNAWDEDAAERALEELGVEFEADSVWNAYLEDQSTQCDFVVGKQNYEGSRLARFAGGIGIKNVDGEMVILYDNLDASYPGHQAFVQKFKRCYTEKAAENLLRSFGYRVTKQADGTYRATATMKTASALSKRQTKSVPRVQKVSF